jgi:hypothetical protein
MLVTLARSFYRARPPRTGEGTKAQQQQHLASMNASSSKLAGQVALQGETAAHPAAAAAATGGEGAASILPPTILSHEQQNVGCVSPAVAKTDAQRHGSSKDEIPAEAQHQQAELPEKGLPVLLSSIFKRGSRSESTASITDKGLGAHKASSPSHASGASAEAAPGDRPPALLSVMFRRSKGASGSAPAAGGVPLTPGASVSGKGPAGNCGNGDKAEHWASGPGAAAAGPLAPDSALASAPDDPLLQPGVLDAVNIKVLCVSSPYSAHQWSICAWPK